MEDQRGEAGWAQRRRCCLFLLGSLCCLAVYCMEEIWGRADRKRGELATQQRRRRRGGSRRREEDGGTLTPGLATCLGTVIDNQKGSTQARKTWAVIGPASSSPNCTPPTSRCWPRFFHMSGDAESLRGESSCWSVRAKGSKAERFAIERASTLAHLGDGERPEKSLVDLLIRCGPSLRPDPPLSLPAPHHTLTESQTAKSRLHKAHQHPTCARLLSKYSSSPTRSIPCSTAIVRDGRITITEEQSS
ncbi:uncharacterized protein EI97DRAFT_40087 [Westerdykella ornata]|uniref:Uncharacterized protein n=1 Tax=Westerdykella ornata TaxID=318751 RepID=A0A6A6JLA9_WESOR|nr:uncharacterized protein EI97DRAFT_40087 [Westerdykella ornata]KAF2276446.1 hypothetical protein EI97DRAFT_40087 [Westerdykella ornata]